MPTKPDKLPRWADVPTNNGPSSESNVFEPTELKKDRGWDWDERPPREHFNWLHLKTYEWLDYHRDLWDNAGAVTLNFAVDEANVSGLTFALLAGTAARRQGVFTVSANTYALTANATNRVYLNLDTQSVVVTDGALPTYNVLPLYTTVTDGSSILSTTDNRTWLKHPAQLVQDANNYLDLQDSLLALTMDGANRFLITDTQARAVAGGVGSGYSFMGDTNTGISSDGSGTMTLYSDTSSQAILNNTGFGVGVNPTHKFHVADSPNMESFIDYLSGTTTFEIGTSSVKPDGSVIAQHRYRGQDSSNSSLIYAQTYGIATSNTSGVEYGEFRIDTVRNGSLATMARVSIDLGEDIGSRFSDMLNISGTTPKFKMSTGSVTIDDGFQIHCDFSGNGVTSLLGFDTDVISIKPNNQEGIYCRWTGSSTATGFNGITNPLDAIHVEGSIRAGGASGAYLSAYYGATNYTRVFNGATRQGLEDLTFGEMISRDKSTGKVFIDGPVGVNNTDPICDFEVNGSFCATEILGNNYAETSESGNTSIVDTGISPEAGAVYDIIITGNPNTAGSPSYRSTIHLLAYITVGNDGPTITQYIDTVEQFSVSGLHSTGGNEIQAAVTFWDGSTESDDFPVATPNVRIRVKVSGYNLAGVGANQTVRIKKVN